MRTILLFLAAVAMSAQTVTVTMDERGYATFSNGTSKDVAAVDFYVRTSSGDRVAHVVEINLFDTKPFLLKGAMRTGTINLPAHDGPVVIKGLVAVFDDGSIQGTISKSRWSLPAHVRMRDAIVNGWPIHVVHDDMAGNWDGWVKHFTRDPNISSRFVYDDVNPDTPPCPPDCPPPACYQAQINPAAYANGILNGSHLFDQYGNPKAQTAAESPGNVYATATGTCTVACIHHAGATINASFSIYSQCETWTLWASAYADYGYNSYMLGVSADDWVTGYESPGGGYMEYQCSWTEPTVSGLQSGTCP